MSAAAMSSVRVVSPRGAEMEPALRRASHAGRGRRRAVVVMALSRRPAGAGAAASMSK